MEKRIFTIPESGRTPSRRARSRNNGNSVSRTSVGGVGWRKESICHLMARCKALNFTHHTHRHDLICAEVHGKIGRRIGVVKGPPRGPWNHKPERATFQGDHQLFWNRDWDDTARLQHSKPDIVWAKKHEVLVIEVATPADHNVGTREEEKVTKHIPLCEQSRTFRRPARNERMNEIPGAKARVWHRAKHRCIVFSAGLSAFTTSARASLN